MFHVPTASTETSLTLHAREIEMLIYFFIIFVNLNKKKMLNGG